MPRIKLSAYILPLVLLGIITFITYSAYVKTNSQSDVATQHNAADTPKLPSELLSCNEIKSAETTAAFVTCLQYAEQGYQDAQRKIAWAYTREGEHQDWQQAFDWLKKIATVDTDVELLSQIVLFILGESDQDKINAETDIRHLADIRFPAAEAYLATLYYLELNKLPRDANPAWLLRKAYDFDKSIVSPFEMATVYANGFGTRPNTARAKQVLVEYANEDFPFAANNVAWFLATLDRNPITDPEFVVSLAESTVSAPEFNDRYSFVDTLAASYAAVGDFEKATTTQQQAIELLINQEPDDGNQVEDISEFEARLELYQNGKRPILDSMEVDLETFFKDLKQDIERILLSSLNVYIDPESVSSGDASSLNETQADS